MCLRYPNTQWACTATKCMSSRTEYEVPESEPAVPESKPAVPESKPVVPEPTPVKPATKHLRPSTIRRQQEPPKPFIEPCNSPDCTGATTDVDTVHTMAIDCVPCHKRRGRDMRWHLESEWWFRSHGYGEKLGTMFEEQCCKYRGWAACAWDQMWRDMTDDAFTKKGTPMYGPTMKEQMQIVDGYWRVLMTWTRKNFPQPSAAGDERGKKRKRESGDDEDDSEDDEGDSEDDSDDGDDEDDDNDDEDDWYKSDTELNDPRPKQRRRLSSSLGGSDTDSCGGGERGQRRKKADPLKMGRRGSDPDDDYDADADDTDDGYDTEVPSEDDVHKSETDSLLDLRPTQRQRRSSSSLAGSDIYGCGGGQKRKRVATPCPDPDDDDADNGYNHEVPSGDAGYDTGLPDLRPRQRQRRSSNSRTRSDTHDWGEDNGRGPGSRSSTD